MFIRKIAIRRFRTFEDLQWSPAERVNCLVGPGDAGKSTILSALERLLDPSISAPSELDYRRRRVEEGFEIKAILGDLDEDFVASMRNPPLLGWLNGELKPLPDEGGAEQVLLAKATGTPDLEIVHELITPGEADNVPFTQPMRSRLLFSRVTTAARGWQELRLGRRTLLERHLRAASLQQELRKAATDALGEMEVPEDVTEGVSELRKLFSDAGLPDDLSLGVIPPRGWSLLSLLGLMEGEDAAESIPLAFAGSGTRQLAIFRLATGMMGSSPIIAMDEPETGLEPYRQRLLVSEIRKAVSTNGQAFLTTHSPAIVGALKPGELSLVAPRANPVQLTGRYLERVQRDIPDAFLSRLPVLCEGATETGFLSCFLNDFAWRDRETSIDALGIKLGTREGQPQILEEAKQLLKKGISIGLFVDNEAKFAGRRERLRKNGNCAFGTWSDVRNVEEAVAAWFPWEKLDLILELAAEINRKSKTSLQQQIGERVGIPGESSLDELRDACSENDVREALALAMDSNGWFKTEANGRALGDGLLEIGVPEEINDALRDWWHRLLEVCGCQTPG